MIALCPPYLSAIAPNIGPDKPHINICNPTANPDSVKDILRSFLKSGKNKPNVCLNPIDTKIITQADNKVIKANLLGINFSIT